MLCVKASIIFSLLMLLFVASYPLGLATPETLVSVDPRESNVKVGQTFSINVNVTNVSELLGFDFCLSYDTAILKLSSVEEGSFLKNVGSTFAINMTTEGTVWFVVVLFNPQGVVTSANGSGVLATIAFKAIATGETLLDLYSCPRDPCRPDEVKLAKDPPDSVAHIPNVAFDGCVKVSPASDPPSDPTPDPPQDLQVEKSPDVDQNGRVDICDVAIVASAFGSSPNPSINWDQRADLDNDQDVDIVDVSIVAKQFGMQV